MTQNSLPSGSAITRKPRRRTPPGVALRAPRPLLFGSRIGGCDVEVHAILLLWMGLIGLLKADAHLFLAPQPDVRARTVHDRSAEQFGPECGEPLGVGSVDDDGVDLQGHFCHASIFSPRAVARHGRRMPKAGHWSCRAAPEGRRSGGQMPRYLAQQVGEYGRLSGPVVRFPRRRFRTGGTWDRAAPAGSVAAPALPTGCPGPLRVNGTDPTGGWTERAGRRSQRYPTVPNRRS